MAPRPHAQRLLGDLKETRDELRDSILKFTPDQLDWAPKSGMKSVRAMLAEVCAMEEMSIGWAANQKEEDWMAIEERFKSVKSPQEAIELLDAARAKTIQYLERDHADDLQNPIPLLESWHQYFNVTEIEPEELVRWVVRHEYYHLGQLISYLWFLGHDPYKPE